MDDRVPFNHAAACGCGFCLPAPRPGPGRRTMLAATGGALLAAALSRPARAQTALSPDEALAQLMAGNGRFVAKQMTSFAEDLTILKQNTVAKQEPFAALLSCADSRVPVELVFDQTIGHMFVTRVAGNIATPEIVGSLEYGAAVLGTSVIMVLGHEACGAVKAAIAAKPVPGQISVLFPPLRPAIKLSGPDLAAAIKANALVQANMLATGSTVLAGLIEQGKLKVVAGYYTLGDGTVTLLD